MVEDDQNDGASVAAAQAPRPMLRRRHLLISSVIVAVLVAGALFLRPSRTIHPEPELSLPAHVSAEVRASLHQKMLRHGADTRELLNYLVLLDSDGAVRAAGRVYDEWSAGPSANDERFAKTLPRRFFALQEQLKQEAKSIVAAGARKDSVALAEQFSALTRTCVSCHQSYLFDRGGED